MFEQIFDFYTFKNHTFESKRVDWHHRLKKSEEDIWKKNQTVMSIYSYTVKSAIFESVKIKISKVSGWFQKSFPRRSENDTFESVKIESVRLDWLSRPYNYIVVHIEMRESWDHLWESFYLCSLFRSSFPPPQARFAFWAKHIVSLNDDRPIQCIHGDSCYKGRLQRQRLIIEV